MAIHTYLSIIESKKQNKWTNTTESQIQGWFPGGKGMGGVGEKGEGVKKYKRVVTEQSWGCKIQQGI